MLLPVPTSVTLIPTGPPFGCDLQNRNGSGRLAENIEQVANCLILVDYGLTTRLVNDTDQPPEVIVDVANIIGINSLRVKNE